MAELHERPVELLQRLLRFDTSNPPGAERACIEWLAGLLGERGLETRTIAADPERPSLVARLPGRGIAPPLLLQGHVDVVPVGGATWARDPFAGAVADGFVWGRGALDMKGGVAMMVAATLRAARAGARPAGDVILALLADEESGGRLGARHLVREHPDLLDGVRYALGEFGGFTMDIAGRRLYPIQVAEKQACTVHATVRGPGGHGSLPMRGGTTARLARLLRDLERHRLPIRVTDVPRRMVETMARELPIALAPALRALLAPGLADLVLRGLGRAGAALEPMLRNTATATVVEAGEKVNVVPDHATVTLDGRLVPGATDSEFLAELRAAVGDDVEFDVARYEPGRDAVDYGLFGLLAGVLRERDPTGVPVPMLLPAVTDGRIFAALGIQTYGFTPMQLPDSMRFQQLIHAVDERIPVDAVEFGTRAITAVLERYRG